MELWYVNFTFLGELVEYSVLGAQSEQAWATYSARKSERSPTS